MLSAAERADVEQVAPLVRNLVYAMFGAKRFPVFEQADVYQAAMLAVCSARHRFDPSASATWTTFAYGRARGAILDFLRTQRPGTRTHPAENPLSLDETPDDETDATFLDHLAYEEPDRPLELALRALIEDLPDRERSMFRLHVEADLTLREVGAMHGVLESRASQIIESARGKLAPGVLALIS